jgi:putative phosphoesterase
MKVAILSDVHDNIWKLAEVLEQVNGSGAEVLIFCGDLCAPFTLEQIGEGFGRPVHVVLGNNDGDPLFLARIASRFDHITLHGFFAYLELAGRRIAVNHYPPLALDQARSGQYDMVCHGHDHTANIERVGDTLLIDPGEVMGRLGTSTYALYDTTTGKAAIRQV